MNIQIIIVIVTVLISTVFGFASHVIIQGWEDSLSAEHAHLFESALNKDKFGADVLFAAGITAILPVIAAYFILLAIWRVVPGDNWWKKGLIYSILLLALKSQLIREPIMGVIMEVPIWMVAAKQLDVWIPNIILGLILAWGVKVHRGKVHNKSN